MSIASAFNEITVAHGGTASNSGSIASAIDALNDALAGSDQPGAATIEDAVRLLGQHIGGGPAPSGTIEITENGEHDVSAYAVADVSVSGGASFGSPTKMLQYQSQNPEVGSYVFLASFSEVAELYSGSDLLIGTTNFVQGISGVDCIASGLKIRSIEIPQATPDPDPIVYDVTLSGNDNDGYTIATITEMTTDIEVTRFENEYHDKMKYYTLTVPEVAENHYALVNFVYGG